LTTVYEGMFLLDNQVVREDWKKAKGLVTDALQKHGGTVLASRRWDERKLAYPIKRRRRGTFCLTYYQMGNEGITGLRRDLELSEHVLRYLIVATDAVPEGELELAAAEDAADFSAPTPPPAAAPDAPSGGRRRHSGDGSDGDGSASETSGDDRETTQDSDSEDSDASGKDD
jgi:small subunit ribosomal protein S6